MTLKWEEKACFAGRAEFRDHDLIAVDGNGTRYFIAAVCDRTGGKFTFASFDLYGQEQVTREGTTLAAVKAEIERDYRGRDAA